MKKILILIRAVLLMVACGGVMAAPLTLAVQKPRGSDVEVRYRVTVSDAGARSAQLQLSFANVGPGGDANVRLATSPGLSFAPGTVQQWQLPPGASSATVELTIVGDEPQYVHVFTTQRGATSAVSVAVRADGGRREAPAASRPRVDPDDADNVIVLPVD